MDNDIFPTPEELAVMEQAAIDSPKFWDDLTEFLGSGVPFTEEEMQAKLASRPSLRIEPITARIRAARIAAGLDK